MHMSKKTSCVGCRAYAGDAANNEGHCALGYRTELVPHHTQRHMLFLHPAEECPKPITKFDLEMLLVLKWQSRTIKTLKEKLYFTGRQT